ncbi:hypothetical protein [Cognatiluteimonas profundi]|uniref:hypothetical protein n=1 Tax=Cognatiluteimonas profundi TaxID=2594501 RepID=UPI00131E2794|nr:hypothetical protein [Lysobacter profundi]
MRRITLAVALCLAGTAHCQTLYRCVHGGIDSYQQSPCPPSSRTVSATEVAPEAPPTDVERRRRLDKAEQDRAESAFLSHQAGTDQASVSRRSASHRLPRRQTSGRSRDGDSCEAARIASNAARKALGLGRTYNDLQRLDESVRAACSRG